MNFYYNEAQLIPTNIDNLLSNLYNIFSIGTSVLIIFPLILEHFNDKFGNDLTKTLAYHWSKHPKRFKIFVKLIIGTVPANTFLYCYYIYCKTILSVFILFLIFVFESIVFSCFIYDTISILVEEVSILSLDNGYKHIINKIQNCPDLYGFGINYCYFNELNMFFNKSFSKPIIYISSYSSRKRKDEIIDQVTETFIDIIEKDQSIRTWILIYGISYSLGQELLKCTDENIVLTVFELLAKNISTNFKIKHCMNSIPIRSILFISLIVNSISYKTNYLFQKLTRNNYFTDSMNNLFKLQEYINFDSALLQSFFVCCNCDEFSKYTYNSNFLYNYKVNLFLKFIEILHANLFLEENIKVIDSNKMLSMDLLNRSINLSIAYRKKEIKEVDRDYELFRYI